MARSLEEINLVETVTPGAPLSRPVCLDLSVLGFFSYQEYSGHPSESKRNQDVA